ncbi:MAG: hypothetical protein QM488_10165 [Rhizobiaceae bacterium]
MKMTNFICLKALPQWLALDRKDRVTISEQALSRVLEGTSVSYRYFDAEAFSSHISDVAMIEAETPREYYFAIEWLRDSQLFPVPYFELVETIPTFENGFQVFEADQYSEGRVG